MRRLVLVRHGESRWNADARIQGQRCAGLSPLGHEQARVTATALAGAYPDAALITSDLQRTVETVAPLQAALGRPAGHDALLRERAFGSWEGLLRTEVAAGDPDRWQRWLAGEDVIAEVGGESAQQLADRVAPVLARLMAEVPDGGVTIAVTHGGSIHHGIHRWLDLRAGTLGGVANTSVTEVLAWDGREGSTASGDRLALDRWNEIAHLPLPLRNVWRPSTEHAPRPPVDR